MSTIEVRPAAERDHRAVIDVITLAFSTDPMARWAYPDPATYLAVAGLLTGIALLASAAPAWRATRVDPVVALRTE